MSAKTMAERVEEYLAYRRALGYQVRTQGGMLRSFARFADESGHLGPLTSEIALPGPACRSGRPGCTRPGDWKW